MLSAVLKSAESVEIVFDRDVLENEYCGCSDGTTTGYMKIKTKDITDVFLKSLGRTYRVI